MYLMRNAPLRCSSKATNVCMRRGFELNTCEGMAHWPPESGASAHGLACQSEFIPKKNRHPESVPLLNVFVA